ncbi:MAG TPA: hypothetical protein VEL73_09885 [Mycobacteriales bacterium]|nr:hypothetical protein [Mycobacteriales bacterium]
MLVVAPHGSFRNGFDLLDEAGGPVGSFRASPWRESGDVRVGDRVWRLHTVGRRRFVLDGSDGMLASADKPSPWSARWRLTTGDQTYELTKRSWRSRGFELRGRGQMLGEVRPRSAFSGKAVADLPAELPPPVQVFVVAVVLALWRREQASAAAGTAAATTV